MAFVAAEKYRVMDPGRNLELKKVPTGGPEVRRAYFHRIGHAEARMGGGISWTEDMRAPTEGERAVLGPSVTVVLVHHVDGPAQDDFSSQSVQVDGFTRRESLDIIRSASRPKTHLQAGRKASLRGGHLTGADQLG